jgi:N-methylhydantoinase B
MYYRVRSKHDWVSVAYTRSKTLPWSLNKGREGSANYIEVIRKNKKIEKYSVVTGLGLEPGDIVRIYTGNGGGFGDPKTRNKEMIKSDLLNEYITKGQAKKYYGYKK